jgi:hypothetical protein
LKSVPKPERSFFTPSPPDTKGRGKRRKRKEREEGREGRPERKKRRGRKGKRRKRQMPIQHRIGLL